MAMKSKALWAGWVLSALPAPLFLLSAPMKLRGGPELEEGFAHLGFPPSLGTPPGD